jgi:hypothetical protein
VQSERQSVSVQRRYAEANEWVVAVAAQSNGRCLFVVIVRITRSFASPTVDDYCGL